MPAWRWSGRSVPEEDKVDIVYKVNQGEKHELEAVQIEGNKYFNECDDSRATDHPAQELDPHQWAI